MTYKELINLACGRVEEEVKDDCEVVSDWFRLNTDSVELKHILLPLAEWMNE